MLKIITKYTAYLLVFLLFSNAYAEENFCLDEDGFILPIFDQTNCETSAEIKINEKEFTYIIEFEESKRTVELKNYRQNYKEIEENRKKEIANKSRDQLKKIAEENKLLGKKKISKIKKDQEEKKLVRQKRIRNKKTTCKKRK